MLAIRMQRTGRKGQAQFRMIVQDSRRTPTSGNIVELLGSYDPHTKVANINKERAAFFLSNGAQPSDRALRILSYQKVEIPEWVKKAIVKKSTVKNPTKLRKNQPKVEKVVEAEPVDEVVADTEIEPVITPELEEEVTSTEAEPTEEPVPVPEASEKKAE
ncbi:MAG TPA: 30S ribosomal protein S16 [Candidatus Saccharimonadales bacterium]